MSNSTHKVEVVPITLEKHPNADSLSVVNVFGGYTCVVRTPDWAGVTVGAYLPPDSVVDTLRPEFAFLTPKAKVDGSHRVKAVKLRGLVSFGLLVRAPEGSHLGDDVADRLGVTHYEPPLPGAGNPSYLTGGEAAKAPDVFTTKYDVDAFRRYHSLFHPGEKVWVTEKIHGANARYVFHDGVMHCGSRTEWKKEYPTYDHVTLEYLMANVKKLAPGKTLEETCKGILERLQEKPKQKNLWWATLDLNPEIGDWCRKNPGQVLYGEVYGQVQNLNYGATREKPYRFAAFDILEQEQWVPAERARDQGVDLPWVPLLGVEPYDFDQVVGHSDGPSKVLGATHHREGCVVKPLIERVAPEIGRVQLKCVGATYLEKD